MMIDDGESITGWWLISTPLKDRKVNWDDDIPNMWRKIRNDPNHQPVKVGVQVPFHHGFCYANN